MLTIFLNDFSLILLTILFDLGKTRNRTRILTDCRLIARADLRDINARLRKSRASQCKREHKRSDRISGFHDRDPQILKQGKWLGRATNAALPAPEWG